MSLKRIGRMTSALLVSTALMGSAYGADLSYGKAPAVMAPVPFTWTGFYVGAFGGYSWDNNTWNLDPLDKTAVWAQKNNIIPPGLPISPRGPVIGGTIGYNYQLSGPWVIGVEADWGWADITDSNSSIGNLIAFIPVNFATSHQQKISDIGTFRGRAGYAWDRLFIYGTVGLAWGNETASSSVMGNGFVQSIGWAGGVSKYAIGWTAGAGAEYALTSNLSIKGEILYYDLGDQTYTLAPINNLSHLISNGGQATAHFNGVEPRIGLNYRF